MQEISTCLYEWNILGHSLMQSPGLCPGPSLWQNTLVSSLQTVTCPGVGIIATKKIKVSWELSNRTVLSWLAVGEVDGCCCIVLLEDFPGNLPERRKLMCLLGNCFSGRWPNHSRCREAGCLLQSLHHHYHACLEHALGAVWKIRTASLRDYTECEQLVIFRAL